MKITLEIKDKSHADMFIAFLKSLNYIKIKESKSITDEIPDWHIAILQKRLSSFQKNKNAATDLETALDEIEKEL